MLTTEGWNWGAELFPTLVGGYGLVCRYRVHGLEPQEPEGHSDRPQQGEQPAFSHQVDGDGRTQQGQFSEHFPEAVKKRRVKSCRARYCPFADA